MTGRIATWSAAGLFGLCLAMVGFALASALTPTTPELPDRPTILTFSAAMSAFIALPTVGVILAIRRPLNPVGWLFLICGTGFILSTFSTEYVGRVVVAGMDLPGASLVDWLNVFTGTASITLALVFIPMLFPNGHLVGPGWRPVAWAGGVLVVVGAAAAVLLQTEDGYGGLLPNPIVVGPPISGLAKALTDVYFPAMLVLAVLSLASLMTRFRRSRDVERQQLKWFLFAGSYLVVAVMAAAITQTDLAWYATMFGLASLPIAAGVAIFRYRLYEIDRLVSRSIAYALVTGGLVAVYLVVNLGLTNAFSSLTRSEPVVVAASTLIVAALFTPVRRRVQRVVDRRFDRARYDADRTVLAFSERLRDEVDLPAVTADLDATVQVGRGSEDGRPLVAGGRTMRGRTVAAIVVWTLTLGASLLAFGLVIATRDTAVPDSWGFRGASELFGVTCGTIGAIVAIRRPDNAIGWLFCAIGASFAFQSLVNEYVLASVFVVPGGLPMTIQLGWLLAWIWVPPLGLALIYLPLLFPNGHLLSPRWRVVALFGALAIVGFSLAMAFVPGPIQQAKFLDNPLGLPGVSVEAYASIVYTLAIGPLALAIGLAMASLVRRFRQAPDEPRRQIKWFALAALVAGTTNTIYQVIAIVGAPPTVVKAMEILVVVSLIGLPTAAGLAILRYRLFDIDRIISRTISYGVISAVLAAVFLVVNLALQSALSSVTKTNSLAVAASTLLVAALFTPIRRRVHRAVDRRFDRARYDAERTTFLFSERLRDQVDLPALVEDLDDTVRGAVAPSSVDLWLRSGTSR